MEGRGLAKGNLPQPNASRTPSRTDALSALERVRQAAKKDKKLRFTALLHPIYSLETLRAAYFSLKREAAPGVDGETWRHYGETLEANLQDLSGRLKRGAYRAKPVRINRRVSRQSFCAVLGVSEEGQCFEVLALEMGDREHMDLWESVFRSLLERGLKGEAVELCIMDGLPGLEAVFQRFFPCARTQRCQKHAKANACRPVRKAEREAFSKDLNQVFYAVNEAAARTAFFAVKDRWGRLFPSAVGRVEKDLDSSLTFFQFDATYWTVLRTTNPIERLNKEFKRRTRAMEVTGGEISTYRCLAYVAQTMEYRWSFHPLSQWAAVYTQNAA